MSLKGHGLQELFHDYRRGKRLVWTVHRKDESPLGERVPTDENGTRRVSSPPARKPDKVLINVRLIPNWLSTREVKKYFNKVNHCRHVVSCCCSSGQDNMLVSAYLFDGVPCVFYRRHLINANSSQAMTCWKFPARCNLGQSVSWTQAEQAVRAVLPPPANKWRLIRRG